MVEQIAELEREIAKALSAHPGGAIFRAFFRAFFGSPEAVICAATLLSEVGDCGARYLHRDAIAADGGRAPVAIESGKRKGAKFRWACNERLRNALGTLAFNIRRWNPWAADLYAQARARGHTHRRARGMISRPAGACVEIRYRGYVGLRDGSPACGRRTPAGRVVAG